MRKHIIPFIIAIFLIILSLTPMFLGVATIMYKEYMEELPVKQLFEDKKYPDITLKYCIEGKCYYDFGKGKEHIRIWTNGSENIEMRIELARKIAKEWPFSISLCKSYEKNLCYL